MESASGPILSYLPGLMLTVSGSSIVKEMELCNMAALLCPGLGGLESYLVKIIIIKNNFSYNLSRCNQDNLLNLHYCD